MQAVTDEVPQITGCQTWYFNPDLPARTLFRLGARGIEGVYSDGRYCAKFRVETTAETPDQSLAVVALLNDWLEARG